MITVHQEPSLYTPVYNPMRFVLSSTNSAQTNFKYVVDVYVSGVSGYTRLLCDTDPNNGQCAPDVSRVIESYISSDFSHTTPFDFRRCTNSIKGYEVKFGEQYGPSSGVVTYPDLTVTGLKYAWNGVLDPLTFHTYDYTLYTMGMGAALLTSRPGASNYENVNDNDYLYFINDTSGCAYYAQIKLYDSSNNLLTHARIENIFQASSSYLDKLLRVGIGPDDINGASYFTIVSGSILMFANPLYSYYTVQITDFTGATGSETYTFNTVCSSKYGNPIRLFFLNSFGGYDVFNFTLKRKYTSNIKRDTYQKNLGTLSNHSWSYADQDGGDTVYNTEITDVISAESDWISDAQATWLKQLVESPRVLYHDGTASGTIVQVVIQNKSYETKNIANEKMFNLSIEFQLSNKRWRQRG